MVETLPSLQVGLSLAAGALSTLSPCVFPLLPIVAGGAAQAHRRAGPVVMGAGLVCAFVLVGVMLAAAGPVLGLEAAHVRSTAAVLMIAIAAAMLWPSRGVRAPGLLSNLAAAAQRLSLRVHPERLTGAFLLGGLLGVVWSPCSGPLLGSGIALVASDGGLLDGGLVLGMFGVGAAVPLVCAAYCSRALHARLRTWVSAHGPSMRSAFAVMMLTMGVAVLTGADHWIQAELVELAPGWWLEMTASY